MWPASAAILLLALTGSGCAAMDNPFYGGDYGPRHGYGYYDSWYRPAPTYYSSTYYVTRPPHHAPPRYAPPPAHHQPAPPFHHETRGDRDGHHGGQGPRHDQPPSAYNNGPSHNNGPRHNDGPRHDGGSPQHADNQPRPQQNSGGPGFHSQGPRPGR